MPRLTGPQRRILEELADGGVFTWCPVEYRYDMSVAPGAASRRVQVRSVMPLFELRLVTTDFEPGSSDLRPVTLTVEGARWLAWYAAPPVQVELLLLAGAQRRVLEDLAAGGVLVPPRGGAPSPYSMTYPGRPDVARRVIRATTVEALAALGFVGAAVGAPRGARGPVLAEPGAAWLAAYQAAAARRQESRARNALNGG